MLTSAAIEAHFLEAVALRDWGAVAACERALTGIISVATMKLLSAEVCVLVRAFELTLSGVPSGMVPVPESYLRITTMTQDMAIALLEEKLGQRVGMVDATRVTHDDDAEVCVEFDLDVSDFQSPMTASAVVIHDRAPTPVQMGIFLDCTDLDNVDDDKTVVPS